LRYLFVQGLTPLALSAAVPRSRLARHRHTADAVR
jgi:hypothetical protein